MQIPAWQRLLGILVYMIPWSDAIPFGSNIFNQLPYLQWLAMPALPIMILQRGIPFGGLLLFLLLFLAVIRNPQVPYFLRFNSLQALLIDIGLILLGYAFRILVFPFGTGLLTQTLSSTVLIGVLTITIFSIYECIQGKEPDLPAISEAVRLQL